VTAPLCSGSVSTEQSFVDCYSVAEYCCPAWSRSSHVGLVDSQLNNAMHLISGCVQPTQTLWLPVLVNIAPPALRRRSATDKLLCNIEAHPNWPLYADVFDHPQKLLSTKVQWEEDWSLAATVNSHLVCDPTIQQPGFDLPRHSWTLLNRFRTGQGPCCAQMGTCLVSTLWLRRATDSCPLTNGQQLSCMRPYYPTAWLRPATSLLDTAESFPHRPRPMLCTDRDLTRLHSVIAESNRLVSAHKTGWQLVEPLWSRWQCYQLAEDDIVEGTCEMKCGLLWQLEQYLSTTPQ